MDGVSIVTIIASVLLSSWVYNDAKKRGMNAFLWALLAFLMGFIGLAIYLVARRKHRQAAKISPPIEARPLTVPSESAEMGTETRKEPEVEALPATAALPSEQLPQALVTAETQPEQLSGAVVPPSSEAVEVSAQLQAPRGTIPIASFPQTFGREDFRQLLPPQLINLIIRKHFMISYDPEQNTFYIQDLNSTNGTYVNGVDIRGKGPVPLKNGDLIVPANVIPLKFITNIY
jgi:hypothetical protein